MVGGVSGGCRWEGWSVKSILVGKFYWGCMVVVESELLLGSVCMWTRPLNSGLKPGRRLELCRAGPKAGKADP